MGRFDENGDLWIEVELSGAIPTGVEHSGFGKSSHTPFGLAKACTEINLTAYIADLVKNPQRR